MKVYELINILKHYDPNLDVMVFNRFESVEDVCGVKILHWKDQGEKLLICDNYEIKQKR